MQALRTVCRFKTYTVLNVAGLVLSLSCAFVLARYIHQERTVDHFVPELDRTFLLTTLYEDGGRSIGNTQNLNNDPNFRNPLAHPEVEGFTRFYCFPDDKLQVDGQLVPVRTIFADSLFLRFLPFPILAGEDAMNRPDMALISEELARRLWGDEDPLGKTLQDVSLGKELTVCGVLGEAATKSSFQFDLIVSSLSGSDWSRVSWELVHLRRAKDLEAVNEKNKEFMALIENSGRPISYRLMPLKDFYMTADLGLKGSILHGHPRVVTLLGFVTALLVIVGLFNYMNLHAVMMLKRQKEFSIRKVYGGSGRSVFGQLFLENFCIGAVALFLVWTVVEVTRVPVERGLQIPVRSDLTFDLELSLLVLVGMPLLTTLYPFARYSLAPPVRSMHLSEPVRRHSLRGNAIFLFGQFAVTIGILVAATYFARQLDFLLHYDLNFRSKDILRTAPFYNEEANWIITDWAENQRKWKQREETWERLSHKLGASPLFSSWTTGAIPMQDGFTEEATGPSGEPVELSIRYIDAHYMETFDIRLKDGRPWEPGKDQLEQYKMMLTEEAARRLGVKDLHTDRVQLGNRIWHSGRVDNNYNPPYEVVGIVEDFCSGSLTERDLPAAFVYHEKRGDSPLLLAVNPGHREEAVAFMKGLWDELMGGGAMEYGWAEDDIRDLYAQDRLQMRIFLLFAAVAILISVLGLLGISLYDIRCRYREIALRKVHGASPRDLFVLLSRQYAFVWLAAFAVASGVSYAALTRYVEGFAHHAPLSADIFLWAGAATALLTLAVLGLQIRRAIRMNPADVLKNE